MTKAEQDRFWEYLVRIDEKVDATREEVSALRGQVKSLCEDGVVGRITRLESRAAWLTGAVVGVTTIAGLAVSVIALYF